MRSGSYVVKRSNRLLILLGILLAVTGAVGAMVIASGGSSKTSGPSVASPSITPEPKIQVVVANRNIAAGVQITADMVTTSQETVSKVAAAGGDTFQDPAMISGRITAVSITKGQIIVGSTDLLTPGSMTDGQSISQEVAAGMVAVTMEVDQVNGVGTLIVPGDRVNIVLSVYVPQLGLSNIKDPAGNQLSVDASKDVTTKMIIQNRRVLGTLLPPAGSTGAATAEGSAPPVAPVPTTPVVQNVGRHMIVVVEVKPDEAEILRWAQREEATDAQNYFDLSLALRSSQDNDAPDATTPGITYKMLIDKYGVLPLDPRVIIPPDIAKGIQW
jgi:Flp pilus assembly protein CpaB